MEYYEKQLNALVKSLRSEFYIWLGALLVLAVMSFTLGGNIDKLKPDLSISLQSILLVVLLAGLPSIFIWFRNRTRVLAGIGDILLRLQRYELWARIRQSLFFILGLLILFVHVFTVMKGAYLLLLVVLVLGMFIIPSRGRVMMEAGLLKPEEEEEKDEEDVGSE